MVSSPKIPAARSAGGFTLIELIVALAILVIVLGMAYKILDNCLRTEKWVERENLPEKIGEGLIALFRRDIEGAIYRNLGTDEVFQVVDGGAGESARDEIQFYTTKEKTPLDDPARRGTEMDARTITPVTYYLKENGKGFFTLFRREALMGEANPFAGGGGISYEIYDKVVSLNIECFDSLQYDMSGIPWIEFWDSRTRILEAAQYDQEMAADESGVVRVTEGTGGASDPGVQPEVDLEAPLPPAAIPSAVRVEVMIMAGDERGVFKDKDGITPLPPKVYSAIIPILAAQRIPLTLEDESLTDGAGGSGLPGSDDPSDPGGTQVFGQTAGRNEPAAAGNAPRPPSRAPVIPPRR